MDTVVHMDRKNLPRDAVLESHPLKPFLPADGRILFLGSFPPPRSRWSMEFFYPNFINDFWRIQGLLHFNDPSHFEISGEKRFDCGKIVSFCQEKGLAFYDTASVVCRLKGNASDEFLEIVEPADIASLLEAMPDCTTIVTTGGKSAQELLEIFNSSGASLRKIPAVGDSLEAEAFGRHLRLWRMPSTSRAFPMKLQDKAAYYSRLF